MLGLFIQVLESMLEIQQFCSLGMPWWESLVLLKCSPFRISFTFRKRKNLPMPNLASREDVGLHRLIWKQETASHSECSEQALCHETAAGCCCFLTRFQDIQVA